MKFKKDEWFKNGIISIIHIKAHENYQQTEKFDTLSWQDSICAQVGEKKETKLLIGKLYWNNANKKRKKERKKGRKKEEGREERND